jgi:hypothetical protein
MPAGRASKDGDRGRSTRDWMLQALVTLGGHVFLSTCPCALSKRRLHANHCQRKIHDQPLDRLVNYISIYTLLDRGRMQVTTDSLRQT